MIVEVNKLVKSWIDKKFIRSVLNQAFKAVKKKKKIDVFSVALVGQKTIKNLNKRYRRVDRVTDVLSFDDPVEIIICWPQLVKQAREQKHGQKKELTILLIHGLLHILGYNHRTKKQRLLMERKNKEIEHWLKRKKLIK